MEYSNIRPKDPRVFLSLDTVRTVTAPTASAVVGSNSRPASSVVVPQAWPITGGDYAIALALIVVAGLGRVLEHGKGFKNLVAWRLGPELCLAGMSVDLAKLLEWWRAPGLPTKNDLVDVIVALAIALLAYILVLCFHQTWAHTKPETKGQTIVQNVALIVVCNALGMAAVLSFFFFPKP